MKKTLIITWDFPPQIGGISTYVKRFADSMPSDKVVILTFKIPKQKAECKEIDSAVPYKVIRKNLLFPKFIWPRWLRLVWQVWRIVKKEKIEAIHIHNVLPAGYAGFVMKKFKKIPYLIFGHGVDFRNATKNAWKAGQVCRVCRKAEQVIVNSEHFKKLWSDYFTELANKITLVYPCPDPDFFVSPSEKDIEDLRYKYALNGKKVMFTTSRLSEGKGFPHLLRLIPAILEKVPNLVWLVVGDGPKKEELIKQIQKNNLQNVVRFLGFVPHAEIKKFYYASDLFTLLTHPDEGRVEGLGLVFLEAAACGLPAVGGKSGGVEEALKDGVTGLVVDIHRGDKFLVQTIVTLLQDEKKLKYFGEQAKLRASYDFKWENQIIKLKEWL